MGLISQILNQVLHSIGIFNQECGSVKSRRSRAHNFLSKEVGDKRLKSLEDLEKG